jgi:ParB-like nuclease domain
MPTSPPDDQRPILVRRVDDTLVLVDGHRRLETAHRLGWPTIAVQDADTGERWDHPLGAEDNPCP